MFRREEADHSFYLKQENPELRTGFPHVPKPRHGSLENLMRGMMKSRSLPLH
jgi:hypothetical protein